MKRYLLLFSCLVLIFVTGCAYGNYSVKPNTSDLISEEQAIKIALDKAGLSEDEIIIEKFKLEFDDRIYKYDFEFRKGKTEYNAEIKADDGTVIGWEIDFD